MTTDREPPPVFKRLRNALLLLFVFAAGAAFFLYKIAAHVRAPVGVSDVRFEIPGGAGPETVARILCDAGLSNWKFGTKWGFKLFGRPAELKAGVYFVGPGYSLEKVFADLQSGRVELVDVTIPEGTSAVEIGKLLENAGLVDSGDFIGVVNDASSPARWGVPGPSLEGFLFPDTYRFARGLSPDQIITEMIRRFFEVATPMTPQLKSRGLTLLSWTTLASIVEKETGDESEKPRIAAVFINRLKNRMRLESDPTVIYGIAEFDGNIRKDDLKTPTPYNTYVIKGLPPGPITNPGKTSLSAVLNPEPVGYLYFVSRNDGTHAFSTTYEEHKAAVNLYQRRRK